MFRRTRLISCILLAFGCASAGRAEGTATQREDLQNSM